MKKYYFLILLLFGCSNHKPIDYLKPIICVENGLGGGSAVIIRSELFENKYRNLAITCNHCLSSSKTFVNVCNYDDNGKVLKYDRYPAFIYLKNKRVDLAILVFESNKKLNVAKLDFNYEPIFGDNVTKIGYGLGHDASLNEGTITSPFSNDIYIGLIRTNISVVGGDSGGALYKSRKVIGIVRAYVRDMDKHHNNISYFIPITSLSCFEKDFINDPLPVIPFLMLKINFIQIL